MVDILPLESGSVDPQSFANPDPDLGSQNLAVRFKDLNMNIVEVDSREEVLGDFMSVNEEIICSPYILNLNHLIVK